MQHLQNELKNNIFYEVKLKMGWNDRVCEEWWVKPNMNFGDMSPKQMVEEGLGKNLLAYVKRINE